MANLPEDLKTPDSCLGSCVAPFWTTASYWHVHAADVFDFVNHGCQFEYSPVGEEKCFCPQVLTWGMKNVEKVKLFYSCTFECNLEVFLKCSFDLVLIISPSRFHYTFIQSSHPTACCFFGLRCDFVLACPPPVLWLLHVELSFCTISALEQNSFIKINR